MFAPSNKTSVATFGFRFLFLLLIAGISSTFVLIPFIASASNAPAIGWTGWDALDTVVNTADPTDLFVAEAVSELDLYLEQISGRAWTSTTSDPGGLAIRLSVDPTDPALAGRNDEAVHIVSDASGINITGASNIALREGVSILLEKAGVRWFFKHEDWTVVPTSLADFDAFDEVHEPEFTHREIWHSKGINSGGWGNPGDYMTWKRRNKLDGSTQVRAGHSYSATVPLDDPIAPPEVYCPSAAAIWPWQLRPDHPYVENASIDRVRDIFSSFDSENGLSPEVEFPLAWISANVSPNDTSIEGWCAEYGEDRQVISDLVFGLADTVATALESEYPDHYINVYSYAEHDLVPTIPLHPNVLPMVAEFGTSELPGTSYRERVSDFGDLNTLHLGVRDYYDVSQWSHDRPPGVNWGADTYTLLRDIPFFASNGVDVVVMEAADGWGSRGLLYYAASKLYWDPYADLDAIFQDFYDNAFGPASAPMERYFERILTAVPPTERFFALSFRDLDEAEQLAAGNTPVLNRIRQTQYYVRYYWLRTLIDRGDTSTDLLKDIYDVVYRTRELYVLHHWSRAAQIKSALESAGVSALDITNLENTTPPSSAEARAWMDEALAYYAAATPIHAPLVDIANLDFVVANDASLPSMPDITTLFPREFLVATSGAESVQVEGNATNEITWNDPTGQPLQSATTGGGPINFASTNAGNHYLTAWGTIDIASNQPAGMLVSTIKPITKTASVSPGRIVNNTKQGAYFHVPPGTPALIVGLRRVSSSVEPTIELHAPTGAGGSLEIALAEQTCTVPSAGIIGQVNICEYPVANPAPGIWRIDYLFGTGGQDLYLLGVPPVIWHDPLTLAVSTGTVPTPTPTPVPTVTPTVAPTAVPTPTLVPTVAPTAIPTATLVPQPTSTSQPAGATATPTPFPTATATSVPNPGGGGGFTPPPPTPTTEPTATTTAVDTSDLASVPTQPQKVTAIPGDGQVLLEIDGPISDGGRPIDGYGIVIVPTYAQLTLDINEPLIVTGLENGVPVRFLVYARNSVGNSIAGTLSGLIVPQTGLVIATATPVPVVIVTPSPTAIPTAVPTIAPTALPQPVPTATAIPQPTPTSTPLPVSQATSTPMPVAVAPPPTPQPTATPVSATVLPVPTAEIIVTATPTAIPTKGPIVFQAPTDLNGSQVSQTLELNAGWNLISFNVAHGNSDPRTLFQSIAGLYTEVSTIRGNESIVFRPDQPDEFNGLTVIEPFTGYWIKLNTSTTLTVHGTALDPTVPRPLQLGWNLVAYLPESPYPIALGLFSLTGKYSEVRGFDVEGVSYFPNLPAQFSTLTEMEPGKGYLINVVEPLAYLFYP